MQRRAPLEDFDEADWHTLMKTNVDSVFFVGQAVARHMIGRRRGKVINICSVQSELGRRFATAVALLNKGLVDVKPLISASLPYRDAGRAFALAADRSQAMKVVLNFD